MRGRGESEKHGDTFFLASNATRKPGSSSLRTVELIPTLGALFSRGGPVQDPVLASRRIDGEAARLWYISADMLYSDGTLGWICYIRNGILGAICHIRMVCEGGYAILGWYLRVDMPCSE